MDGQVAAAGPPISVDCRGLHQGVSVVVQVPARATVLDLKKGLLQQLPAGVPDVNLYHQGKKLKTKQHVSELQLGPHGFLTWLPKATDAQPLRIPPRWWRSLPKQLWADEGSAATAEQPVGGAAATSAAHGEPSSPGLSGAGFIGAARHAEPIGSPRLDTLLPGYASRPQASPAKFKAPTAHSRAVAGSHSTATVPQAQPQHGVLPRSLADETAFSAGPDNAEHCVEHNPPASLSSQADGRVQQVQHKAFGIASQGNITQKDVTMQPLLRGISATVREGVVTEPSGEDCECSDMEGAAGRGVVASSGVLDELLHELNHAQTTHHVRAINSSQPHQQVAQQHATHLPGAAATKVCIDLTGSDDDARATDAATTAAHMTSDQLHMTSDQLHMASDQLQPIQHGGSVASRRRKRARFSNQTPSEKGEPHDGQGAGNDAAHKEDQGVMVTQAADSQNRRNLQNSQLQQASMAMQQEATLCALPLPPELDQLHSVFGVLAEMHGLLLKQHVQPTFSLLAAAVRDLKPGGQTDLQVRHLLLLAQLCPSVVLLRDRSCPHAETDLGSNLLAPGNTPHPAAVHAHHAAAGMGNMAINQSQAAGRALACGPGQPRSTQGNMVLDELHPAGGVSASGLQILPGTRTSTVAAPSPAAMAHVGGSGLEDAYGQGNTVEETAGRGSGVGVIDGTGRGAGTGAGEEDWSWDPEDGGALFRRVTAQGWSDQVAKHVATIDLTQTAPVPAPQNVDGAGTVLLGERTALVLELVDPGKWQPPAAMPAAMSQPPSSATLDRPLLLGSASGCVPTAIMQAGGTGSTFHQTLPGLIGGTGGALGRNVRQRYCSAVRRELVRCVMCLHTQWAQGQSLQLTSKARPKRPSKAPADAASWDPVQQGNWHPKFTESLLYHITLPDVESLLQAPQQAMDGRGTAKPPASIGALMHRSPSPVQFLGAARAPRLLKRDQACTSCEPLSTTQFVDHLQQLAWYKDQVVHVQHIPARASQYGVPQLPLSPQVQAALEARGLQRLYCHQAQAIDALRAGRHVAVATSTASGKSLCYNIPYMEWLVANPEACAIYIFPTKALAQDQLRAVRELMAHAFGAQAPVVEVYDGDTPQHERSHIRESAQLLITNPDMLHRSILPFHGMFKRLLSNLALVVLDEGHAYHGVFGAHTALVMRRLRRLCDALYHCQPRFCVTSATTANPAQHACRLIGVDEVTLVENDGSPTGPKQFVLWNPPLSFSFRRAASAGKAAASKQPLPQPQPQQQQQQQSGQQQQQNGQSGQQVQDPAGGQSSGVELQQQHQQHLVPGQAEQLGSRHRRKSASSKAGGQSSGVELQQQQQPVPGLLADGQQAEEPGGRRRRKSVSSKELPRKYRRVLLDSEVVDGASLQAMHNDEADLASNVPGAEERADGVDEQSAQQQAAPDMGDLSAAELLQQAESHSELQVMDVAFSGQHRSGQGTGCSQQLFRLARNEVRAQLKPLSRAQRTAARYALREANAARFRGTKLSEGLEVWAADAGMSRAVPALKQQLFGSTTSPRSVQPSSVPPSPSQQGVSPSRTTHESQGITVVSPVARQSQGLTSTSLPLESMVQDGVSSAGRQARTHTSQQQGNESVFDTLMGGVDDLVKQEEGRGGGCVLLPAPNVACSDPQTDDKAVAMQIQTPPFGIMLAGGQPTQQQQQQQGSKGATERALPAHPAKQRKLAAQALAALSAASETAMLMKPPRQYNNNQNPDMGTLSGVNTVQPYTAANQQHGADVRDVINLSIGWSLEQAAAAAAHAKRRPPSAKAGSWQAPAPQKATERARGADPYSVAERMPGRGQWKKGQEDEPQALYGEAGTPADQKRDSPMVELALLLAECMQHGLRTIAFCKTRKLAELVAAYTRETLKATAPHLTERLKVYRGGYAPADRRDIEQGLHSGRLLAVAATNALELGVDVGGLDATLHLGFQGSLASLRQQAGRAGRREQSSLAVYVAFDGPLDQYFMNHPTQLFERPIEHAQIDPSNPHVLQQHVMCAAFEWPVEMLPGGRDNAYFGHRLQDSAHALVQGGILGKDPMFHGPHAPVRYCGASEIPAADVSLRTIDDNHFDIVLEGGNQVLEQVEMSNVFYEVYDGAIYMFQGRPYLCKHLDLGARTAIVRPVDVKYYTKVRDITDIHIMSTTKAYPHAPPGAAASDRDSFLNDPPSRARVAPPPPPLLQQQPVKSLHQQHMKSNAQSGVSHVAEGMSDAHHPQGCSCCKGKRMQAVHSAVAPGVEQTVNSANPAPLAVTELVAAQHVQHTQAGQQAQHTQQAQQVQQAQPTQQAEQGQQAKQGQQAHSTQQAQQAQHAQSTQQAQQGQHAQHTQQAQQGQQAQQVQHIPSEGSDQHVSSQPAGRDISLAGVWPLPTTAICEDAIVTVRYLGFHRVWQGTGEIFDKVDLWLPDVRYETQAAHIRVPSTARQACIQARLSFREGVHAAQHAVQNVLPLMVCCNPKDVGTECDNPYDTRYKPERLILYDKHPGGIGLSAQATPLFHELLQRAVALVESCPCELVKGCPSCVQHLDCGNYNAVLNKRAGLLVLRACLEMQQQHALSVVNRRHE